jgi:DnaJ homolog subfamily C member 3
MIFNFSPLALGALILSATPLTKAAIAPSDIPADTPVSQLIATANAKLAAGEAHDALTYFDVAVSRDPKNYLTIFKRGATYLSLGRNAAAQQDFDRVLSIKPNFEGALLQRAKIKSRNAEWDAARKDYAAAGKTGGEEMAQLDEAEGAATLAKEAASKKDWEGCVSNAGVAILVAGTALDIRKLRAQCRFERGEIMEGISDLQHVLQISSGSVQPHLEISAMSFYSLGETEQGLAQIRKCLQSDPDSKVCMKLMKKEKRINKTLAKVNQLIEKRKLINAIQLLIPHGEDPGLIKEVEDDTVDLKMEGLIYPTAQDGLMHKLMEMPCDLYMDVSRWLSLISIYSLLTTYR